MKKISTITAIQIATVFFFSCSNHSKEYILKVKLNKLNTETIYDKDLVYDVIFDAEELNVDSLKNESRKLFLEGMDQYKNKNNIKEGIQLIKSSILIFPESKAYYELGNAILEMDKPFTSFQEKVEKGTKINEAIKAFEVAEHLNFQPISNIYFQKACASNMLYSMDIESAKEDIIYNLRLAFKNGFSDTLTLKNDKRINSVISNPEFQKSVIAMIAQKQQSSENNLFELFKKSFTPVNNQFEVSLDNVDMKDYKESINYDFAEFIPEMQNTNFGRDVNHDYFYVAKVSETSQFTALIYASISFYGGEMQPTSTTLATYDNEGNMISRKLIACQCSAEKIKKCSIDNNNIVIEEYKRTWESPIDKVSFEENKIINNELISSAKFKIEDTGKIVDVDVPSNFKDSAITVSLN